MPQDRLEVDCPRARTWMTPCIARDGRTALADPPVCVGCGANPAKLLDELAGRYAPARDHGATTLADQADALTRLVAEYIDT